MNNNNQFSNGAITFLDVLGWKGIYKSKDNAIDKLIDILNDANETKEWAEDSLFERDYLRNFKTEEINIFSLSDTIVIYSLGDIFNSILSHGIISSWIISRSIEVELPIRGAICFGNFLVKNRNIMLGPAIDEVSSWYENTDWIGVILTPSTYLQTIKAEFFENDKIRGFFYKVFCQYDAPLKVGNLTTLCVDWVRTHVGSKSEIRTEKDNLINCFINMGPITQDISKKIFNSLYFFEKMSARLPE